MKQNENTSKEKNCNNCSYNYDNAKKEINDSNYNTCEEGCNSSCCDCDGGNELDLENKNDFSYLEGLSVDDLKEIIKKMQGELEQKDKSLFMLQNKLNNVILAAKQIGADFDNFRKRTENEKQKEIQLATKSFIIKLLPIMDQFSLCLQHTNHAEEFAKGISLMYTQIMTLMGDSGLKPINALNQKFDPKMHEAIMLVSSKGEENIVIEEVQKGYFLYDTIIRMSKVKVSKNIQDMEE